MGYISLDSACGGDSGTSQIDLAAGIAHTPDKVTVRGRDRALALSEDTHMPAEARPAGRGGEHRAGFDQYLRETVLDRLHPDRLCRGDDQETHIGMHLPALEQVRGDLDILVLAVRARPHKDLIDLHAGRLGDVLRVLGKVRKRDLRLYL